MQLDTFEPSVGGCHALQLVAGKWLYLNFASGEFGTPVASYSTANGFSPSPYTGGGGVIWDNNTCAGKPSGIDNGGNFGSDESGTFSYVQAGEGIRLLWTDDTWHTYTVAASSAIPAGSYYSWQGGPA